MAATIKPLNPGQLIPDTLTNMYTVPPGTTTMITKLTLTNTTANNISVNIHLSTTNTGNTTSPLGSYTLAANQTLTVDHALKHAVQAGGSILAQASQTNSVILKLTGIEFT